MADPATQVPPTGTKQRRALQWLLSRRRWLQAQREPSPAVDADQSESHHQARDSAAAGPESAKPLCTPPVALRGSDAPPPAAPKPQSTPTPALQQHTVAEVARLTAALPPTSPNRHAVVKPALGFAPAPAAPPAVDCSWPGTKSAVQQGVLSTQSHADQAQQRRCTVSCKRKSVEIVQRSALPDSVAGHAAKLRCSRDSSRPAPPPTADYTRSSFFQAGRPELPAVEPVTPPASLAPAPAWHHRRQEVLARRQPADEAAATIEASCQQDGER
ncbi:hypothetical protein ABPG77_004244 [Micractinium sp. CCAP 211/92]